MKSKTTFIFLALLMACILSATSQAQDSTKTKENNLKHDQHFVDKNGDGYNDNAPDHDEDGIPNGLDPDWIKLKKNKGKGKRHRFVDLDGDGINDNLQRNEMDRNKNRQQSRDSDSSLEGKGQNQKGHGQKKRGSKQK